MTKKFQKEFDRVCKCLDNVERKQDEFEKSQDQMAKYIKEIKSTMTLFIGGANPPFSPSATQSPKTSEDRIFPSHEFQSMHEKPRVPQIQFEHSSIQSSLIKTTVKLKGNYLSTMVRTIRASLCG